MLMAQNRFGRNDVEAYLEAQLAIQEIISKESSSGRKKQRQSVARYVGDGNTPVAPKAPLVLPAPPRLSCIQLPALLSIG